MLYLAGLCCLLSAAVILLLSKVYVMKKSAQEIARGFAEKLAADTNTLIDISTRDKDMIALARAVNTQLRILRRRHHRYTTGDMELKTAITNISHDLRTPLTTICGYLDIMKGMDKPEKISRYLAIIYERAEFMKQLTEELFSYSVILSGGEGEDREDVYINQLLAESVSGYYNLLTRRGITPKISITEQKIIRNVSRRALSRVFGNLLNNAVKYSDGDLSVTLSDTGKITFANTAKGLSAVSVERLFDRFYTVTNARNSTGLGLSIARTLTDQIGGDIKAEYKDEKLFITLTL